MNTETAAGNPFAALKPGSLREARLRRKFAKTLGLNPAASWARILQAVQAGSAARNGGAGGDSASHCPLAGTTPDLHELLGQLMTMHPISHGLKKARPSPKIELPQPLEALRSECPAAPN